jgi:pyridoxal biosynthesis lyase PdxS
MLKGGVIMDVTNPEQAKIAEAAGGLKNVRLPGIWLPNENVYSFAV